MEVGADEAHRAAEAQAADAACRQAGPDGMVGEDGRTPPPGLMAGTVIRAIGGIYDVRPSVVADGVAELYRCTLRDRLRKQLVHTESRSRPRRVSAVRRLPVVEPVVAGDRVYFRPAPTSGVAVPSGVIEAILPRTRELARQAVTAGSVPVGQTILANLDQVIIVFSAANPPPNLGLVDRFLVSCEAEQLPAVLCLNKVDLGIPEGLEHDLAVYARAGYPILRTSAVTGAGIEALRDAVRNKTSAFVGQSGVGKSSLLNCLQPGLGLRVGEVSAATGRGTHTTRSTQLFPLQEGGFVADTPGLRQLALWEVSRDELDRFFPEFRPYLGQCRFGNCAHVEEVGCAVKAAVERGEIDRRRYRSYVQLFMGEDR